MSSELLPAPEGPVMKWNEPRGRLSEMSLSTSGPRPYRMDTSEKRRISSAEESPAASLAFLDMEAEIGDLGVRVLERPIRPS